MRNDSLCSSQSGVISLHKAAFISPDDFMFKTWYSLSFILLSKNEMLSFLSRVFLLIYLSIFSSLTVEVVSSVGLFVEIVPVCSCVSVLLFEQAVKEKISANTHAMQMIFFILIHILFKLIFVFSIFLFLLRD